MKNVIALAVILYISTSALFGQSVKQTPSQLTISVNQQTKKSGLKNGKGYLVIPEEYDAIEYLNNGYHKLIKQTNKYQKVGLADDSGKIIIKANRFDQIYLAKKPGGEMKFILTRPNDKIFTIDKGRIVRDWSND